MAFKEGEDTRDFVEREVATDLLKYGLDIHKMAEKSADCCVMIVHNTIDGKFPTDGLMEHIMKTFTLEELAFKLLNQTAEVVSTSLSGGHLKDFLKTNNAGEKPMIDFERFAAEMRKRNGPK